MLGAIRQDFTKDQWSLFACRTAGSRLCSPVAKVTFSFNIASSDAAKAGSFLRMLAQLGQYCQLGVIKLSLDT